MSLWSVYLLNPAMLAVAGLVFCTVLAVAVILYRQNNRPK